MGSDIRFDILADDALSEEIFVRVTVPRPDSILTVVAGDIIKKEAAAGGFVFRTG